MRDSSGLVPLAQEMSHAHNNRGPVLDTRDIQATVLRPRPSPYRGEYILLRVSDIGEGREML